MNRPRFCTALAWILGCSLAQSAGSLTSTASAPTPSSAASAASRLLRSHGYPVDGKLLKNPALGYEALVHSWDSTSPNKTGNTKQVSHQMCNVLKDDTLYFQWPLAGFATGPDRHIRPHWCAKLDRSAVGTVDVRPNAPVYFTRRRTMVEYPTAHIVPSDMRDRFTAWVRLSGPSALRTDWSEGNESFYLYAERKYEKEPTFHEVRWKSSQVAYVVLPQLSAEQRDSLRTLQGVFRDQGVEVSLLEPLAALQDFQQPSAMQSLVEGRPVLRLTPSAKPESRVSYVLPLRGVAVQSLPVILVERGTKEVSVVLQYQTLTPQ